MSRESSKWLNLHTLIGFVKARGQAWHYRAEDQGKESNHYDEAIPVADVRRRLLNFEVAEAQPLITLSDGTQIPYVQRGTDWKAYYRTDTNAGLGMHTVRHTGHGYDEWLIRNVENLLDDGLSIGSAGLLRDGAQCWVSVEMPANVDSPAGDSFRPSLLACTSFDGSLATTYKMVMTRVVCDNTLSCATSEDGAQFRVKHTSGSLLKIADARAALGIMFANTDAFFADIDVLANTSVSDEQWAKFLDLHTPLPEVQKTKGGGPGRGYTMAEGKRDALTALYVNDPRVSPWTGTAYGVVQAANTWLLHSSQVKGITGGIGHTRGQRNVSLALGSGIAQDDARVREALALALA